MQKRSLSRRPIQPFVPSPPPGAVAGAGRAPAGVSLAENSPPDRALPTCTVGAPPGAPPGATRPAPRLGGMRGVGAPPELRRRIPGAVRAAPGAAEVANRMRLTLGNGQRKLLDSRRKLQSTVDALRARLAPDQ